MPTKKRSKGRTAKPTKVSPAALIGDLVSAKGAPPPATLDGEAREFVEGVLAHNDVNPRNLRISRKRTVDTLEEKLGTTISGVALENFVQRELGRSSWGRK